MRKFSARLRKAIDASDSAPLDARATRILRLRQGDLAVLTALILICSTAITPELGDCTPENAIAVMRMPVEFASPATCFLHASAYLAETSLGQDLGADDLIKIVCVRSNTLTASP